MLLNHPEMPQHLILAMDRHRHLIEEARRQREHALLRRLGQERLPRWRRWCRRVGELLINTGRRLAPDAAAESHRPKTVWG